MQHTFPLYECEFEVTGLSRSSEVDGMTKNYSLRLLSNSMCCWLQVGDCIRIDSITLIVDESEDDQLWRDLVMLESERGSGDDVVLGRGSDDGVECASVCDDTS